MIKQRKDGLIEAEALTEQEKLIFIKFLEYERDRHQEDIDKIDETLKRLKNEFES